MLILGASGDIGKEIAKKFASNGYDIFATYNNGKIDYFFELEKKFNIKIITKKMDINLYNDIKECFKEAFNSFSYIDCIICNIGVAKKEQLLIDYSEEEINELINVNLKGTILCNKEAISYFIKQKRGNIINIASIYGMFGGSCEAVYSSTKAGIIGLTKSLAQEYGQLKIRINSISPGFIETKMTACFNKEEKNNIIESTPLQRLGTTEDVANCAYFLASEDSSFITGENILVSGGAIKYN